MKMRIITSVLLIITLSTSLFSQDTIRKAMPFVKKNSVQAELLGNGFYLFSVNYERIILNGSRFKTAGQIGIGGFFSGEINIPIVINEIISFNDNHLEIGLGYIAIPNAGNSIVLTGRLGYRYQKPDSHFVFRLGFTPIIGMEKNGTSTDLVRVLYYWGGITFGYCF
jgi:hypothetical protein